MKPHEAGRSFNSASLTLWCLETALRGYKHQLASGKIVKEDGSAELWQDMGA